MFFSGHGDTQTLGGRDYGYLAPYNAGKSYGSLISMETLRSLSEKMGAAKHQLFIIDACFGGLFAPTKAPVAGIARTHPRYVREIARRTARQFITAGGKGQQVLDGGLNGYSYFTGYLLDALDKGLGDLDGDGYITLSELAGYLVPKATNDYQTPGTGTLPGHGLGEFLFQSPVAVRTASRGDSPPTVLDTGRGLKGKSGTEQQETLFWQSIKDSNRAEDYRAYLDAFPTGIFAPLARNRVRQLAPAIPSAGTVGPVARREPAEEKRLSDALPQTAFSEYFGKHPGDVMLELSNYLQNNFTRIGASLEITHIWKYRKAPETELTPGPNDSPICLNFDVRLGRDETGNRDGCFLIEIRDGRMRVNGHWALAL